MADRVLSEREIQQRREAGYQPKHGLRSAFAAGRADETALTTLQRTRLAEIRGDLGTLEGALEILQDRTARIVLLCEWAESSLHEIADEKGGAAAFGTNLLQRYVSVLESARRHLELLIRLQSKGDGDGLAAERAHIERVIESQNDDAAE